MDLLMFIFMAAVAVLSDGFTVHGPSGLVVVSLGTSVVLPCYVDKSLPMEGLEVEWRRTDSETLVHLYQDGESQPEAQQQDYQDRAHFFTDQIQHGNFSLRLDNLRAEDEGKYTCKVYSQQDSGDTEVQITVDNVERLLVSGSSRSISASVGEDVTLNCSVDSHIKPEHIEEVSWKKTDEDVEIVVLLYQDNEAFPDSSNERYRDRVEFFTDEIPKGNFSLRLKSVRTEDKGVYMCQVFAGRLSANTTVVLERLGFSALQIMVLILSIAASGSALLLCCLIYCRTQNDSFLRLHLSLVFCPNMILFFAFVFWGVSEGSVNETVSCSALYFLRPLLLLWAAPYINKFTGKIQTWIQEYSYVAEYVVFSLVAYSALFKTAWQKILNYAGFERVVIIVLFSIMFLCCLCKIIYLLVTEIGKKSGRIIEIFGLVSDMIIEILPTLQFMILFYTFASGAGGFIIIVILPVFMMMTNDRWFYRCYRVGCSDSAISTVMIIFTLVMNAVMIGVYIMTLEKTTDPIGWACVLVFLQILGTVMKFTDTTNVFLRLSLGFHRYVLMYVFGSVGVVFLSSAALITELILKTVNGDRTVADLRFIVFPVECVFAVSVLISGLFASQITNCLKSCKDSVKSRRERRSQQKKMKEMKPGDQEDLEMMSPGETQPDSVMSQT
ncbi:uncharacterized protein LOC143710966 isoform X1 [Siphateles boraxobius]|uniref:uncharacterized protein LOC143710966 isoform X1 n=1 Tax=Siphateles boraxobius TaxID=180520 RepID=UPI004063ACB8